MKLNIRYTLEEDGLLLKEWLPPELRYFPIGEGSELDVAVNNWIGFAKYKCSLTVEMDGKPCAIGTLFLMPYRKVAHHSMFYMIVNKTERERGVGYLLLQNLAHLAKNYFRLEMLHCEVFDGCKLVSLLEKAGFEQMAAQPHFVNNGGGDYQTRILYNKIL